MARRQTLDDDIDRLSENLFINEGVIISDRDSFDLALERYLGDNKLSGDSKEKVFTTYQSEHRDTTSKERLHKKAGGKDLEKDRRQTAKTVVKTREEFIKKGARRVDFAGFDIKESEIRRLKLKPPKEFNIAARVKNKIVFAKVTTFRIKGESVSRLRDQMGRFASKK